MTWRWSAAGWLMLGGAAFFAVAVGYVWRRRGDALAVSLLVMLLAGLEWSVAYALELSSADPAARQLWGDLKYVGICLLTPAWLAFVFHYTSRVRWPSRLVGALLAVEAVGRSAVELLPALGDHAAGQATASELPVAGRTYDLVVSPLPGRPGRRGGQLVVARDVTERRQAEQVLRAAFEREQAATEHLRSLDELKSAFLQAVSHDLRTPLASVLGIALTLERSRGALPTADVEDLYGRLSANARRLDRILRGLLDLDRLARGLVEPRRERVDLGALVAAAVDQTQADLVGDHPIFVELASVEIAIDSAKVERIVENLLVNASRHTPPGTPIWVRVDPRAPGALLTVADAGPGVPAEQRERIFQPFHRGPGATSYAPGSGVGLALVAQFAGLHGGRAWVEPRAGGGASFQVLLPDAADVAPPADPMSSVTG